MKMYKTDTIEDCIKSFAFRNKYDVRANELSRKILDKIKNNQMGDFFDDNISVKIVKQKIDYATFENFYINALTENDEIRIDIFLDDEFYVRDYQKFNFTIYEVLRHELEHFDRYIMGKKPDEKYIQLYNSFKVQHTNEDYIKMVAQYILSDVEIDSYVKSIMYVAKKQNKSAWEVIEQIIKRVFFGNNSETMKETMKNPEMIKIIDGVRKTLREKLKEYYPTFKEKWL